MSEDERNLVLGEVLADELNAIHELVKDVPTIKQVVHTLKEDVSELKSDIKIVKAALFVVSKQVSDHERRITYLEAA